MALVFCVRVDRHIVFHRVIQKSVRLAGVCTSHMTPVMKKKRNRDISKAFWR